ncbi:MAG: M6 family metalloprotease domain-containing protein [Bacteroidaceae bacterium]|nr:M6 family metalloprotease domain-containing protein [Bacteroidaceae bacterium]
MKKIILSLIAIAAFVSLHAIPAKRVPFNVTQSDSTELTLQNNGDENFHFLSTTEGMPVIKVNNSYFYATLEDSILVATDILAHNSDYQSNEEKEFLANNIEATQQEISNVWTALLKKRNAIHINKAKARKAQAKTFGYPSSFKGEKNGLVILVNFSNKTMKSAHTNEVFYEQFNKEGYSENNHIGSVRDYFHDQSYGALTINFDVIGPLTLSKAYSYYGANENGNDKRVCEMTIEACKLADKAGVDFSKYDWDGDGQVEQVYIIYAGQGEHTTDNANLIWPHEYELSLGKVGGDGTGPITLDGVTIDTYAMSCELASSKGDLCGIGTACHEFSHCLGLPDAYDTSYNGGYGMQGWDLLDSGSYNGPGYNGEIPAGYTAYERWFAGWLDFVKLDSPCKVKDMPSLESSPTAYIIYNDATKNEYFVLENRQPDKWHSYFLDYEGMHGMLVTHIDYNEEAWVDNSVNSDESHQRMSVIPADNSYGILRNNQRQQYYDVSEKEAYGDLFPGYDDVTELTNSSNLKTGGKLFNKNTDGTYYMNKPITDITEENGLISFTFMGGSEEVINAIADIDSDTNSAKKYYTLSGIALDAEPTEPGIYIIRQGTETKKIQVK